MKCDLNIFCSPFLRHIFSNYNPPPPYLCQCSRRRIKLHQHRVIKNKLAEIYVRNVIPHRLQFQLSAKFSSEELSVADAHFVHRDIVIERIFKVANDVKLSGSFLYLCGKYTVVTERGCRGTSYTPSPTTKSSINSS